MDPFGVKLKKIKVSTTISKALRSPTHNKNIKDLQFIFGGQNNLHETVIQRNVEVLEDEDDND